MEQKFKDTLRAIMHGTTSYKLIWDYLADAYYNDAEVYYSSMSEGKHYVSFDSAFQAVYDDLLFVIACAEVTTDFGEEQDVSELFELRIYAYDDEQLDFESTLLLYESVDEPYADDLKNLYTLAASSASGVDKLMDKLIAELGE